MIQAAACPLTRLRTGRSHIKSDSDMSPHASKRATLASQPLHHCNQPLKQHIPAHGQSFKKNIWSQPYWSVIRYEHYSQPLRWMLRWL